MTAPQHPLHTIPVTDAHPRYVCLLQSWQQRARFLSLQVHFCDGAPLQGGLDALRVLELGHCMGPLPIACALPALQAGLLVHLHVIADTCHA